MGLSTGRPSALLELRELAGLELMRIASGTAETHMRSTKSNLPNIVRTYSGIMKIGVCIVAVALSGFARFANASAIAQQSSAAQAQSASIEGVVRDAAGKPVAEASVHLEQKGVRNSIETKTNSAGGFRYSDLGAGSFTLVAEKAGLRSPPTAVVTTSLPEPRYIELTLEPVGAVPEGSDSTSASAMQFADAPNFTVAAVTDWTAAGGHGSDSSLRTSEALTRETLTLKPQGGTADAAKGSNPQVSEAALRGALAAAPGKFEPNHELGELYLNAGRYQDSIPLLRAAYRIDPKNAANEYDLALALKGSGDFSGAREHVDKLMAGKETADLDRLSGEIAEKAGDPLTAVRRFEEAVREDPSEQNYFEWGSELLVHRAVLQAKDVFATGAKLYPKSARMLTALGAALFAGAFYDEAAQRLCEASDLNPANPEPYLFMGKIEIAAPNPLACVEQKLERFVQLQPENPLANYYYAMTVWKQQGLSIDANQLQKVEAMLTKAVTIDPQCSEAYLELGELNVSRHDYERAIGFYTKAIQADPQLSEAHYRLGMAYDRIGDRANAAKEFQIHDEIRKQQAAEVERQRRAVKQFLVVVPDKSASAQ